MKHVLRVATLAALTGLPALAEPPPPEVEWHAVEVGAQRVRITRRQDAYGLRVFVHNGAARAVAARCRLRLFYGAKRHPFDFDRTIEARPDGGVGEAHFRQDGLAQLHSWEGDCTLNPVKAPVPVQCDSRPNVMLRDLLLLRRANKVNALVWHDGAGMKTTRSLETIARRVRELDKVPGAPAPAPAAGAPPCGKAPPPAKAPPPEKALSDEEFLDQPNDPSRLPDPTPADLAREATRELERARPVFTFCTAKGPVVVTTWHLWKLICDDPAPAPERASTLQEAEEAMKSALEKLTDECREEPGRFFCAPKTPTPRGGTGVRG